ncbi:unnamed protein product [Moneuplotes crassus]|uniref:Uncharacterized protein n=1 Tax=Euplotes crassus TaxID=5936 RepID=A0AAD1XK53_EUPCR|nr:unnamed protein product [Moneuplotes crassus]
MNAEFRCQVCRVIIHTSTCFCEYHAYTTFVDKYQEQLSTNLRAWKESIQTALVNAGEAERLLLQSEEALDRMVLATGSEIVDKRRAYYQQEYFYVNTKFKLFLAKFKALRLYKVDRLYITKNSNESRKVYRNYFYPMKHQLKNLNLVCNTLTSKLGWHLSLITQNAFKTKTLTLRNYTISMAQFKRILVACNTIEHLILNNCKIDADFDSEPDSCLSKEAHKGSTVGKLSLVNCDIQDSKEAFEHFMAKLSPTTEVNFC